MCIRRLIQILQSYLTYIKCALTAHGVLKEDENELFSNHTGHLKTTCAKCHYPLLLQLILLIKKIRLYSHGKNITLFFMFGIFN